MSALPGVVLAAFSSDRCVREDHYAKDLFRTGEEEEGEEVNYGE